MPLSKQIFTILATSSVLAGRTTTAALPTSVPRQSVTNGCLLGSSAIRPLSPTTARRLSSTAGVTGAVGMLGRAVSGMLPLCAASLAPRLLAVIRRGAAQSVVDRKAQSGLRNGHDRDAGDVGPVEQAQHGEQVGRSLGKVATDAEIAGHQRALGHVAAESEQALVGRDRGGAEPHGPSGCVVGRELARRFQWRVS